jgi:serine/threonine protein kinase/WD40 repeat protein
MSSADQRNGTPAPTAPTDGNGRLVEALETYLAALEVGPAPDRTAFAAGYPDIAVELTECLDGLEVMHAASSARRQLPPTGPGTALSDFRFIREIGRGGMGVVYEAEQLSLERRVALKVLPFAATLDPKQLQRFRHEAQAAAQLHHPNIVPAHAVGSEGDVHYYVMQLIDGQSLAAVIEELRNPAGSPAAAAALVDEGPVRDQEQTDVSSPPAPPEARKPPSGSGHRVVGAPALSSVAQLAADFSTERSAKGTAYCRAVAQLGIQAAEALEYAHQMGIIHRDIKPANLLLDCHSKLWVTDFGLACVQGSAGVTLTGDLLGTLRYMSPEQALAKRGLVDHRTDIYSLGVTLYEMLTLRPAIAGHDREEVLRQIAFSEPAAPSRYNRAIPVDLETIVVKAMAKAPEERYATAQDLADDLNRFLEDRPIQARRATPLQRARKWARRHRPLVAGVVGGLMLLLAASVVMYARQQRALADERGRMKRESDESLFETLLDHASAVRQAREPGYRPRALDILRRAVALDILHKDMDRVRDGVLACLGDPLGLEPVPDPRALPRSHLRPGPEMPDGFLVSNSPDGKVFAYRCPLHGIWLMPDPGKKAPYNPMLTYPLGYVHDLKMSPDGRSVATGCDEGLVVWDFPSGALRTTFRGGQIYSVAYHPGGRLIAASGRKVELWSLASHRLVASFPTPDRAARVEVEFSGDGKHLLAIVGGEVAAAWPVRETPEKVYCDGHQGGVPAVAFSPDGRRVATASKDKLVKIWDADTAQLVHTCSGHTGVIEALAFSPDGRFLATGDQLSVVFLWDVETGKRVTLADAQIIPPDVAEYPLATAIGSTAVVASGNVRPDLRRYEVMVPGAIWRMQFSPDSTVLAAGGYAGVMVWQLKPSWWARPALYPQLVVTWRDFANVGILDLAMHPSGREMILMNRHGHLYRMAIETGAVPKALGLQARPEARSLNFDRDGDKLTFVTPEGRLATWDWRDGTTTATDQEAFHVALSSDDRWAATSNAARQVVIYDRVAGKPLLTLPAESADIWCLAWAPDNKRLAVSLSDGNVAVWDLEQVRARLEEFGIVIAPTRVPSAAPLPFGQAPVGQVG